MDAPTTLIISIVAMLIATWLTRLVDWVAKTMHIATGAHTQSGGLRSKLTAFIAVLFDIVVMIFISHSLSLLGWLVPLTPLSASLLGLLFWGIRIIVKDTAYFFSLKWHP